jgi:hypothetical protein
MGLACVANSVSQQKGLEAILRGFEKADTIFLSTVQVQNSFVFHQGHIDGGRDHLCTLAG